MTDAGEDIGPVEPSEELAANATVHRSAWEETIEDMKAQAAQYGEEGWETHAVAALNTAAASKDQAAAADRGYGWGLLHTIPDNYADEFADAIERCEFHEYDVYRQLMEGRVFHLVVLRDPEARVALFVAGNYRLQEAEGCIANAKAEGHLRTWLMTLDGTVVGTVRHEHPSKFFPRWDDFAEFFDRQDED
jgi:hypothetical protein